MLKFEKVTLQDRELLKEFFRSERLESCEYSFQSMFIWAQALQIQYAVADGCIVFRLRDGVNPPSLRFPIGRGDRERAFRLSCEQFIKEGHELRFYGLEPFQYQELWEYDPGFVISPMAEYFDYVYRTEDLIALPGKRYHTKKNHFNAFCKNYRWSYRRATEDDIPEIAAMYDSWLAAREDGDDFHLRCERDAVLLLLKNMEEMPVVAGVLRADGRVCAFCLGEQLNEDTVVIHTEKADGTVRGSYAAINKLYLENEWAHLPFVNREEDLGIPGLRRAKESYYPIRLVQKYRAVKR